LKGLSPASQRLSLRIRQRHYAALFDLSSHHWAVLLLKPISRAALRMENPDFRNCQ
jgi:hypothetical protein